MERLTAKHPKGGYYVLCSVCPRHNKECNGLDDCVYVLTKRLAAYENTGLTPEEINKQDTQRKAMAALADSYKAEIPRWIPVSDRLPESGQRVIVCRKDGRVEQGVYLGVNGWWKVYGTNTKAITHWMPMPAPPAED